MGPKFTAAELSKMLGCPVEYAGPDDGTLGLLARVAVSWKLRAAGDCAAITTSEPPPHSDFEDCSAGLAGLPRAGDVIEGARAFYRVDAVYATLTTPERTFYACRCRLSLRRSARVP